MERLLELPTAYTNHQNNVDAYPLLDALRKRRSRRFGHGMKIDSGPFAYRSEHPPQPLSEEEEAFLAFAACGITAYPLADRVSVIPLAQLAQGGRALVNP